MIFDLEDRRVVFESENYFVAHNATLVGSIVIGDNASIWFNAVLRADHDVITIGAESNVQDGAVLHVDAGSPLTLGRGVTVGHMAMVHGCSVGDFTLVGINSVILDGAQIGKYCLIGANTLIPEGKVIPDGSLVVGSPGRVIRQLTDEQRGRLEWGAAHYVENGQRFRRALRERTEFR
ncbi:MAG: gamma carbonic anhydrase family protein [Verrucomicrobiaceae bacterium]|nr:gamma carbonic anhydrase family protein [Verrucomicrobiaceae bacterium]